MSKRNRCRLKRCLTARSATSPSTCNTHRPLFRAGAKNSQRAAGLEALSAMEGVIPEVSAGYGLDKDEGGERAARAGTKQDGGDAGTARR